LGKKGAAGYKKGEKDDERSKSAQVGNPSYQERGRKIERRDYYYSSIKSSNSLKKRDVQKKAVGGSGIIADRRGKAFRLDKKFHSRSEGFNRESPRGRVREKKAEHFVKEGSIRDEVAS